MRTEVCQARVRGGLLVETHIPTSVAYSTPILGWTTAEREGVLYATEIGTLGVDVYVSCWRFLDRKKVRGIVVWLVEILTGLVHMYVISST